MAATPRIPRRPRGDATREALIAGALGVFAERGYHAVTTRQIAEAAGVNQALIGYHFGGKQALYLAVFDAIAAHVRSRVERPAERLESLLREEGASREACLKGLLELLDAMAAMLLSPETEAFGQLIMREQARPSEAFDRLYAGFMGRLLRIVTAVVARMHPQAGDQEARLRTTAILGQLIVWRTARAGVLRHLDWDGIDENRMAAARAAVRRHVIALLTD